MPGAVASAFESEITSRAILRAGKAAGLTLDKVGELAREVGYVMLGFTPSAELVSRIAEITGDQKTANEIAAAINQEVLLPIREAMKQAYGDEGTKGPPAPVSPPPSSSIFAAGKPPPQPTPVPSRPQPSLRGPEPLIIKSLPTAGVRDQGLGIIGTRRPAAPQTALATPPAPPPPAPKPPLPAAKPRLTEVKPPPAPPIAPAQPARPEPPAPIIGPLGMRPPATGVREQGLGDRERKPIVPEVRPQTPVRSEPPKPAPPAAGYGRAKTAVEQELAAFTQPPAEKPETKPPPMPSGKPTPSAPAIQPSPHVITKEELQREIEKFRTAPAAPSAPPPSAPPASPPPVPLQPSPPAESSPPQPPTQAAAPPPLQLPPQKFPKPQAPEKYEADPYKEAVE